MIHLKQSINSKCVCVCVCVIYSIYIRYILCIYNKYILYICNICVYIHHRSAEGDGYIYTTVCGNSGLYLSVYVIMSKLKS